MTLAPTTAWLVVIAAGLGTLAFRLSSIVAFARAGDLPDPVREVLRFVPPAVLGALVAPAFLVADGGLAVAPTNPRLIAGAAAAAVAWRTGNVLATIAVGMAVLLGAGALGP